MPVTVRNTDILFNDGTTQNTAAGAAPSTDFAGIGSYTFAYYAVASTATTASRASFLAAGATVSGSSLRINGRGTANNVVPATEEVFRFGLTTTVGNTSNSFPTANSTTLPGTWRHMTCAAWTVLASGDPNSFGWFPSIWVRIA